MKGCEQRLPQPRPGAFLQNLRVWVFKMGSELVSWVLGWGGGLRFVSGFGALPAPGQAAGGVLGLPLGLGIPLLREDAEGGGPRGPADEGRPVEVGGLGCHPPVWQPGGRAGARGQTWRRRGES